MKAIINKFSPYLYHWFIRPKWITKRSIHDQLLNHFRLDEEKVLDFGSGTGANSIIFSPDYYIGVDVDGQRIDYSKKKYPRYTFHALQNHILPIESDSIDSILAIAVLHHISTEEIARYLGEFQRVLQPTGRIIVLEPYIDPNKPYRNRFMKWFDNGEYIRDENEYLQLFPEDRFKCCVVQKFRKCLLYNELLFTATYLEE